MSASVAERLRVLAERVHNKPWEHIDNRTVAEHIRVLAEECEEIAGEMRARARTDGSRKHRWAANNREWAARLAGEGK